MEAVSVYNETIYIPSYELKEDNINPMFDRAMEPYPYTMHGERVNEKINKAYEALVLENCFLKLTVLPSMGGRLYSAFDKKHNREMFYKNSVIKPRMIAKRGAWVSGGVEFSFPFGHAPTTMDRVNCSSRTYEDGSASITFGNIELVSYMNWQVELRLYPDKASIEENVRLFNPTAAENSFFFWTNAAVEYNENVRLIYPFDWCVNAIEPQYIRWPFYKHIDCSNVSKTPFSYETFGKLKAEGFFGIYDYGKNCGVVHFADKKKVKGAKYFTWGHDNRGESWNKALTEDGSKYFEIQSGPFETQKVYKFLKPYQELEWTEYWYPVEGMNGFNYAEESLAMNYSVKDGGLEFTLFSVENLEDCNILLEINGRKYQAAKSLSAQTPEMLQFSLEEPVTHDTGFILDIYCGNKSILSYGQRKEFNDEYPDTDVYEDSRVVVDEGFKQKLFNHAVRMESFRKLGEAFNLYRENLEHYPDCPLTLNRLGRLYLKKEQPLEAQKCFRKVLAYDNRNSEARFYLAVVKKDLGDITGARRLFMDIATTESYYNASVFELVKLDIRLGYYKEALELLENHGSVNTFSDFLKCICCRKLNLVLKASMIIEHCSREDEWIYSEKLQLNSLENEDKSSDFTGGDERVNLPLILEYMDMKLYDEAFSILKRIQKPGLKSKLVEMELWNRTGQGNKFLLQEALEAPLDCVFINEKAISSILRENLESDPTGKIEYLLGTYFYTIDRKEEALQALLSSYDKGLRYTVLLRNLGYIYYYYKKDAASAVQYLEEDLLIHPGTNEGSMMLLYRIYKETGNGHLEQLIACIEQAENTSMLKVPLVHSLMETGELDKAMDVIKSNEFDNWENEEISGEAYRNVIIAFALREFERGNTDMARSYIDRVFDYPDNLNGGDSVRSPLSETYYYMGIVYSKAGLEEKALEEFKKGAVEPDSPWILTTDRSRGYSNKCLDQLRKRGYAYGKV